MTSGEVILHLWSMAPLPIAMWASTPHARAIMPRFLTWFYRYLIAHIFLLMLVGQSAGSGAFGYFAMAVVCIYVVIYDYFDANRPDALPIGVKLDALLSLSFESLKARRWPQRSPPSPQRTEDANASLAHGIDLGLLGTTPLSTSSRGKLWALETMLKAHEKVLTAKRSFNEEAIATLRSDEKLQEAYRRTQHWRHDSDAIAARVTDEFKAEADERQLRQKERDERAAEQERKTIIALTQQATAKAEAEVSRRRHEARLLGEVKPKETPEEKFRREAEQILEFGVSGRFGPIAHQCRVALIAKRGGEEHLTEEDHERLEFIFALAQRQEESKS